MQPLTRAFLRLALVMSLVVSGRAIAYAAPKLPDIEKSMFASVRYDCDLGQCRARISLDLIVYNNRTEFRIRGGVSALCHFARVQIWQNGKKVNGHLWYHLYERRYSNVCGDFGREH